MNRLTKKLVLSILTVVLTVVALGTTTFAWFTLGDTVELDKFQAQIIMEDGIEVSLDGMNWYTYIDNDMISTYLAAKNFEALNHVTSADGETFKWLGKDEQGDDALVEADAGSYVQIRLFFRSVSLNNIYWTSYDISSAKKEWTADVSFNHSSEVLGTHEITSGQKFDVYASDAVRVSVVGDVTEVVENYDKTKGNTVLGNGTASGNVDGKFNDKGQANYFEVKTGKLPFGQNTQGTVATSDLSLKPSVLLLSQAYDRGQFPEENSNVGALDYLGHLDIFVWIEGYDNEAYNSILGEIVTISLTFSTKND